MASKQSWPRRPSLTSARLIAIGLAVLCTLVGWGLFVFTGGLYWFLGLFLLSIWVLLQGGPLVVRLLERAGLFGGVRRDGDRLTAGRGTRELRLDEPFQLAIQYNQRDLSYDIWLNQMGVTKTRQVRTEKKAISILLATVAQDDRRFHLVAEDVRPPPPQSFDLKGLSFHRSPIAKPEGSVVRMHPDDLIALLRVLHRIEGGSVVAPPETPDPGGDPRRLFWPTWKLIAGLIVLLGLGIWAAAWCMELAPAPKSDAFETTTVDEQAEKQPFDLRAQRLVGKRVFVHADKGVKLYGVVKKYTVSERRADDATPGATTLTVQVESMKDVMFERMPPDAKLPFGPQGEEIGVGSLIEVAIDLATKAPAGP